MFSVLAATVEMSHDSHAAWLTDYRAAMPILLLIDNVSRLPLLTLQGIISNWWEWYTVGRWRDGQLLSKGTLLSAKLEQSRKVFARSGSGGGRGGLKTMLLIPDIRNFEFHRKLRKSTQKVGKYFVQLKQLFFKYSQRIYL